MGQQFESIITRDITPQKFDKPQLIFFQQNSLSRINQCYNLYKSITDTFAIDDTEFIEIFGNKISIFELLDTDKNLLIDGLQIFSGLVLMSNLIKFQEKIQFLFGLFDFNDLKSLSKIDLQFLLLSCGVVINKIFGLKVPFKEEWVSDFIRQQFTSDRRINISEFMHWASTSQAIRSILNCILQKPTPKQLTILQNKIFMKQQHKLATTDVSRYLPEQKNWLIKNNQIFKENKKDQFTNSDLNPEIAWVYGFRFKDTKQFIEIVDINEEKYLLYYIGKIVVLLNLQSKEQSHYRAHTQQIISITAHDNVIATGQYGTKPAIHIWNSENLQTIKIIKGFHQLGIHMLLFSSCGKYLVSVGCSQNYPTFIYETNKYSIIYSTNCQLPVVDVCRLTSYVTKNSPEFIIATLQKIILMPINEKQLVTSQQFEVKKGSKITCCAFFQTNQYKYLSDYSNTLNKIILTGHQSGQVYIHSLKGYQQTQLNAKLTHQNREIVRIVLMKTAISIVTDSSFIYQWDIDINMKQKIRTVDFTRITEKLSNYDIAQLKPFSAQKNLIVTKSGQLIIYKPESTYDDTFRHKLMPSRYEAQKIQQIITIEGVLNGQKIINKMGTLIYYFYGKEGWIKGVNSKTHTLCDFWNIGEQIICFDVFTQDTNTFMVAGTKSGYLYTRLNFNENIEKLKIKSQIECLSFSMDQNFVVVGKKDNDLSIYSINLGKTGLNFTKSIVLPNIPVNIQTLTKKVLFLTLIDNQSYFVSLRDGNYKQIDSSSETFDKTILEAVYAIKEKNIKLPMLCGSACKSMMAGQVNGNIAIWKNQQSLMNQDIMFLSGHSSYCSGITSTTDQRYVYSSGHHDQLIIVWKIRFYFEQKGPINPPILKQEKIENFECDIIQRQLSYCMYNNDRLIDCYDQHLLVRGINNQTLCRLFKKMMDNWKIQNNTPDIQDTPGIRAKLDHVFGIQTYQKRQTVYSLHSPKRYVYFVSRVVIIYNPSLNKQQIYTGHQNQVTCITTINNDLIASGQCTYKPVIRIWSANNLQTIRIISNVHRWGIIEIFNIQNTLLSYGFNTNDPQTFSLQLTKIQTGQIIGFRNQKQIIYSLAMNPLNNHKFVTTGYNNVTFWKIENGIIVREAKCFTKEQIITCVCYYMLSKGDTDLIVGTRKGDIALISHKKIYLKLKQKAHSKQLNLIKTFHRRKHQPLFITSSQDETIKIWNKKFENIYKQDVRKINFSEFHKWIQKKNSEKQQEYMNFSVQSISFLESKGKQLNLLLATRNGDIIEFNEQIKPNNDEKNQESIADINYILYLKNHSSQIDSNDKKSLLVSHHPKFNILASISKDQNLLFWDTDNNKLILSKNIGSNNSGYPTAIKFSKDGEFLIIGYSDGSLYFQDSKFEHPLQGKTNEKFIFSNSSPISRIANKQGNAVLNIQISESGDHLAVSYNNRIGKFQSSQDHSYICIFVNKSKQKSKHFAKSQNDHYFEKFTTIFRPHTECITTTKNNRYGDAAYSMAFVTSQQKGTIPKLYLIIYYQLVDESGRRVNFLNEGRYTIWDVNASTVITDLDLKLVCSKFFFPNSIYSKYQFHQSILISKPDYEQYPQNNNLLIPQMSAMANINNFLVLGSSNGDLHLVKASCLQYDRFFEHRPTEQQMFVAKTFPAHCSQVNQLQLNQDKSICYSTSINDQCIFKWKLQAEYSKIDEELQRKPLTENDIFGEIPNPDILDENYSRYEQRQNLSRRTFIPPDFKQGFRLIDIIGRRACNVRYNLKYNQNNRAVMSAGHTLIIYDTKKNQKNFLYLKDDINNIFNEISTFTISKDHRLAYVCHNGCKSSIVVWEICSKTPIKRIILSLLSQIIFIALSPSNERLLIYGIDNKKTAYILLLDIQKEQIFGVASFAHKMPWLIKDLQFVPQRQSEFVTCGIEDIKLWSLVGNQLTYQQYPQKKLPDSKAISLCLTFIQNKLVTGCQNGAIVLWTDDPIVKSKHDQMVYVLLANQDMLFSGSKDGSVIIWKFADNDLVVKRKILIDYRLNSLSKVDNSFAQQIQALAYKENRLLVGMRNGSVQQFIIQQKENQQDLIPPQINTSFYHDNQLPKAFFFTNMENQLILYQITNKGTLSAWKIKSYQCLWTYTFKNLDQKCMEVVDMIYSPKSKCVYIIFTEEVHAYQVLNSTDNFQIDFYNPTHSKLEKMNINYARLSPNQQIMALGVDLKQDRNHDPNAEIKLAINFYHVNSGSDFKFLFSIPLRYAPELLDFSKNNKYILIKTKEEVLIRDLTYKNDLTNDAIFKTQWTGDGLIYYQFIQTLKTTFKEQHDDVSISKIVQIQPQKFLIVDTFGGLYLYSNKSPKLITQCRLPMSDISNLSISVDGNFIGVSSQIDRTITVLQLIL